MENSFLFELGTEEIPASMIDPALDQLREAFENFFEERSLSWSAMEVFSTPRRLAVVVEGLPSREPDQSEVVSGPPKAVAFDQEGRPTAAAEGFAKRFDVDIDDLTVEASERGEYLVLRRELEGKALQDLLAQFLPEAIRSISWPKNMYWTSSRFRFIRPLRWFVALWNGEVIPFEFEGVQSDRLSRGHRLLHEGPVRIEHSRHYAGDLEEAFVLVDIQERRRRIEEGLRRMARSDQLRADEDLLKTVVHLNEYPEVVRGDFDQAFLSIPGEVLVTVMRFHQKYFSLEDGEGNLVPSFLTVINTKGDPQGGIREGHEKVLQARLEDAAFFWDSDRKTSLSDRTALLEQVLFQEKLGTYLEKTERMMVLCDHLQGDEDLKMAARLSKADLTTEMVRELPELQGMMGGLYAREEGLPESVWRAIYEHYRPVSVDDDLPETDEGTLLSLVDRIDTLVGCFGIGMIPSGSRDPFGLRRQAQGLVLLLLEKRLPWTLPTLVDLAEKGYPEDFLASESRRALLEFLEQRVESILRRRGFPADVLSAAFGGPPTTVADLEERAAALRDLRSDADFEAVAAAFKRIRNILEKSGGEGAEVREDLLVDSAEKKLYETFVRTRSAMQEAISSRNYKRALREMAAVREPVDTFFDEVLVMAEEDDLRRNRLALLEGFSRLFLKIADVSEIVPQEGGENAG